MDDLERELQRSLTEIRDGASEGYRRSTWEARAETLEMIRKSRVRRFVAVGAALGATAVAIAFFVSVRPSAVERAEDLPITGTPSIDVDDLLVPSGSTPVGDGPIDISVGGVGRVWAANADDDTVSMLDADGTLLESWPVSSRPGDIAIAGGPVWVALPKDGAVVEIRPEAGPQGPIEVFDGPVGSMELTVGADVLWVIARGQQMAVVHEDGTVERIDLEDQPLDVAIRGSDAWVLGLDGTVTPVDQATLTAKSPEFAVDPSTEGDLTYAGDVLWSFTGIDDRLTRLDPTTSLSTGASFDGVVIDLAIDPKVAWVLLDKDGSSWLQPFDRTSGEPTEAARPIEGEAAEMAIAHGFLWVTLTDRDEVARFPKR